MADKAGDTMGRSEVCLLSISDGGADEDGDRSVLVTGLNKH